MTKLAYHGLKTQRSTVESTLPLAASKIEGATTKNKEWEERTINESISPTDFTTPTPSNDASRENYWQTNF